jgi:hypothetical protein
MMSVFPYLWDLPLPRHTKRSETNIVRELRRSIPRQVTDWRGKYMIEGDAEENWRDCRVLDISSAGAGLELLETTAEETEGRNIVLAVHLKATVRNATKGNASDRVRVGAQFVDLSTPELDYIKSLATVGARW